MYIYSHNLGSFDAYFILPALYEFTPNHNDINSLIDDRNRFITITHKHTIQENLFRDEEELDNEATPWGEIHTYFI